MIQTRGVAHFTISVSDTKKSEAFYCDLLGMRSLAANHERGMVFLDSGGDCLVLARSEAGIAPLNQRLAHHALVVDKGAYDSAVSEIKDRGIEIILEDERDDGVVNGRSAYFADPDGNVLEIIDLVHYTGAEN